MSDPVTTTAAVESSTPAPVTLDDLSTTQYDHWRSTGEMPDAPTKQTSTEAVSSPATPVDQAASTDAITKPASEPGAPEKHNAETRIKELLAKNKAMEAEIASFRARPSEQPPTEAASSPAPQSPSLSTIIDAPDLSSPMLREDAFYAQYPDALMSDYVRYVARYEHGALESSRQSRQSFESRKQWYSEAYGKALEAHPDLLAKLPDDLKHADPVDLLPPNVPRSLPNYVMQEVWAAQNPGAVLMHITESAEAMKEIRASQTPADVIRTIARIEARLASPSVNEPAPAGDPVSLAPKPTATLGKKPAQPVNELDEAIAAGDFARYKELTDRKELSRTG